ncbi:uncharacterized protein M6B38_259475 [Iris pallida]|uniref:Uncharacterized protein n=1 Tax=Iris pallida TaxID=29817 RepID=A0AAX6IDY1_IRIPA|nr:uncharacterized protein M6B38_297325 [Iris pallida]KAJ6851530.1 uncharacterized protein M6B38_259475 [Iris pallida]
MEGLRVCSSGSMPLFSTSPSAATKPTRLLNKPMAAQKPAGTKVAAGTRKGTSTVLERTNGALPPVKLLTNVEKLRLLTKAEKAGLLSTAEKLGLSLSTVERLGLLSKAEELGVLSAATDPGTPTTLLSLSLALLLLGPVCVYVVPEQNAVEVVLQAVVALVCVVGGSAAFAASNFVSNLQRSS